MKMGRVDLDFLRLRCVLQGRDRVWFDILISNFKLGIVFLILQVLKRSYIMVLNCRISDSVYIDWNICDR